MATAVKAVPEGLHTVTASLCVSPAEEAITFYEHAFGAKTLSKHMMSGKVGHADLNIGDSIIYVCDEFPTGVTQERYARLQRQNPASRGWNWQVRRRNPQLYVKGRVSHPDHKTIELREWHRVLMNTENQSAAMSNVAFLD